MDYIELNITARDNDEREIIIAELGELPFESFECVGARELKAYIPQEQIYEAKEAIEEILNSYSIESPRYISIEAQNWNQLWESNFEPVRVGSELLIRASFHPSQESYTHEIVITPKMSFGTGHHATTHLMAEAILAMEMEGRRVLDMGCGTGVLAILAMLRGASSADAVDIDEWAYENCCENVEVNGCSEHIRTMMGDVHTIAGESYDVVLANINRNILLADMQSYTAALTSGGELLISGFLEGDEASLMAHAQSLGLSLERRYTREGWVALHLKLN